MNYETNMWAIVVDTDSYAGNFEREMCAYVTGHIGECQVGSEYESEEMQANFENVTHLPDHRNGCFRPCSIEPTPSLANSGFGYVYPKDKHDEYFIIRKKELEDKIAQGTDYNLNHLKQEYDEMLETNKMGCCYAYYSVAVFFDPKPDESQILLFKERANEFFEKVNRHKVKVQGFRLMKYETIRDSISI